MLGRLIIFLYNFLLWLILNMFSLWLLLMFMFFIIKRPNYYTDNETNKNDK